MKPKQDIVQVSAHKYVTLLRGAMERAYRGLGRSEAAAEAARDVEWQTDLRATRLVLTIGAEAHLADLNRDTNLNRPCKFTPEKVSSAVAKSQNKTVADVARRLHASRQKLSEALREHPELDWRKK